MSSVLEAMRELTRAVSSALPCAEQIAALRDDETTALMAELGSLARRVAAASSLVATDIDRRSARELGAAGLAQSSGVRNGPELVQRLTGSSIGEARRLVRVGGMLESAEELVPAEAAGPGPRDLDALRVLSGAWSAPIAVAVRNEWLTAAEAESLRSGLGTPRDPQLAETWRAAALNLIGDGWASEWAAEDFQRAATRARASLDAVAAGADAAARFDARSLKRRKLRSGNWKWDLELDPESDAALWGPLSRRLSPRLGGPRFRTDDEIARAAELEQDPRTNEQLLVDEFTGIYLAGVGAGSAGGAFGRAEPHVSIVVTTADMRKAKEHTGGGCVSEGSAGEGDTGHDVAGGSGNSNSNAGIAWLGGGEAVSALVALRAICSGVFTPVLFDESGKAIDVGKDQRLFTARQRRAMAVRDGGCRWPGCARPPSECEAHHLNPWGENERNRTTEVEDGILLCRFHHLTAHNHGARITRQGSVYRLHWPGRDPVPLSSRSGVVTRLRATAQEHALNERPEKKGAVSRDA